MMADNDNRNSKQTKPGAPNERYPDSPAKVPSDLDEGTRLQTDVTEHRSGASDSDAHHPAAAPTSTDSEAGESGAQGGITPLKRRD